MMRKKTMAFLMAGMMIFGGTMPVFAETETQSGSDTIVLTCPISNHRYLYVPMLY